MADDGKWEKVGKAKTKTRTQRQNVIRNMIKVEDLPTAKIQSPMFEASWKEELKTNGATNGKNHGDNDNKATKATNTKSNPAKRKAKKDPRFLFKSFEDAMQDEEVLKLPEVYGDLKEKFSTNPLICLKEVAAFLNFKISCPDKSPGQLGHAIDYPLSAAQRVVRDLLTKVFGKELNATLVPLLFNHFLLAMTDCISRDVPCYGFKLCIQALAHHHKMACLENTYKCVSELHSSQNQPKKNLAYLWALCQIGAKDVKSGLQVWLSIMLPTLSIRNIAQYEMSYIESLLSRNGGKLPNNIGSNILQPEQFFEIGRWTFNTPEVKSNMSIKTRMQEIYPVFSALMMGSQSSKRNFFAYYLTAAHQESEELSEVLLDLALQCLNTDPHCFSIWREKYLSSMKKTWSLISYVKINSKSMNWKRTTRRLFQEAVRSFRNTNEDLVAKDDDLANKTDFHRVRKLCEAMTHQFINENGESTTALRSFLSTLALAMIGVAIGVLIFDMRQHNHVWEDTKTHEYLEKYGVLPYIMYVKARVIYAADKSRTWMIGHVPYYLDRTTEILGPYIKYIAETLVNVCEKISQALQPAKVWLVSNCSGIWQQAEYYMSYVTKVFLEWLDSVLPYLKEAFSYCVERIFQLYEYVLSLYRGDTTWSQVQTDFKVGFDSLYVVVATACQQTFEYAQTYVKSFNKQHEEL